MKCDQMRFIFQHSSPVVHTLLPSVLLCFDPTDKNVINSWYDVIIWTFHLINFSTHLHSMLRNKITIIHVQIFFNLFLRIFRLSLSVLCTHTHTNTHTHTHTHTHTEGEKEGWRSTIMIRDICKTFFLADLQIYISLLHLFIDLMEIMSGIQSQVEFNQKLKRWYLMPPCSTLSIIRYRSGVSRVIQGKE